MSEQRLKRKGSSRRSSKKRRRRRSSISVSSNGGIDEEEEAILRVIEHDNDDEFEINMNAESDSSRDKDDEDVDSEEEERRERRRRAERRIHEEILMEKINQCKELIEGVKKHTWKMSKKLDVLRKAKAYVEKFEGKLSRGQGYQQRGKQLLKQLSRSWKNFMASLVPWEMKIKQIEGHFGSVVASYFVFLRWLLWISLWLTILPTCFVMIPEMLAGGSYGSSLRKTIPDDELDKAYDLQTIWNAEGVVKYSLVFYGYYGDAKTIGNGYRLPLAYLLTNLAAFAYSFVAVLKTMANNSRNSRMSGQDDEYTFAWKLFTEWDYMITNHDTAITKHASITTVFKESILEIKVKSRSVQKWKMLAIRITCNIVIVLLLALSTYVIQLSVENSRQTEIKQRNDPNYEPGVWEENELTAVMTLISMIFPTFLDIIALVEKYHPRTSLQLMLGRIFVLNLLNLYTLFIALYNKQQDLLASISSLQINTTIHNNCSLLNTTYSPLDATTAMTISLTDNGQGVTTVATAINVTETALCVNVTDVPLKVKEFCWETMIGQVCTGSIVIQAFDDCNNVGGDAVCSLGCPKCRMSDSIKRFLEVHKDMEVFKLTVLDMVALIVQHLVVDVLRTYFVRYCNRLCCWDIEKNTPEYPEFKTAENILHLISNQGVIWLGVLFCPALALLNLVKLYILVYFRCWTVLCYNVPEERIFRASRSNNFYYSLLLVMLFLCMLPPLFAIVGIEPSPNCGPFSGYKRMFYVLTETMETELPSSVNSVIQYAASPGVILPVFMLLGMTIYYLLSVGRTLRNANNELRMQLEYERTEGRRKVYAMADARHEPKSQTKGKGWGAARSSIVHKQKGMANTAMSVLQAARVAKGGQAKGRVHPAQDSVTSAVKKPGQNLLGKLRAAQKLQTVPVAVIRGEQSLKANTSAARERNKIAAQSAFRRALLEYKGSQAQQSTTNLADVIIEDTEETRISTNQNHTVSTKRLQNLKNVITASNRRASPRRQEDEILEEETLTEDNVKQTDVPQKSRGRLWGNIKAKQVLRTASHDQRKLDEQIQHSTSGQKKTTTATSRSSHLTEGRSVTTYGADKTMKISDTGASPKKPVPVQKLPERRRRLSVSSYVDESGYLSPYSEESEEDDEDDDDNDSEHDDENSTEMEVLEEVIEDIPESVGDGPGNDGPLGNYFNDTLAMSQASEEKKSKKRKGIHFPFSKLIKSKLKEGSAHNTPSQPGSKGQSLHKKVKAVPKTIAEVSASENNIDTHQNESSMSRPPLSRVLSSGSISGPVPEITVQDFSETDKNSTDVNPEEVLHQQIDTNELQNIPSDEKDAPVLIEKIAKKTFDIKKSLFSAVPDSQAETDVSTQNHFSNGVKEKNLKSASTTKKTSSQRLVRSTNPLKDKDNNTTILAKHELSSKDDIVQPNEEDENINDDSEAGEDSDRNDEQINVKNDEESNEQGAKNMKFENKTSEPRPLSMSVSSTNIQYNQGLISSQNSKKQAKGKLHAGTKRNGKSKSISAAKTTSSPKAPTENQIEDEESETSESKQQTQRTEEEIPSSYNNVAANAKVLERMKKIGGSNVLQDSKPQLRITETETKLNIGNKRRALQDIAHENKTDEPINESSSDTLTLENLNAGPLFENDLKDIKFLPRLKRIGRDKIPRKNHISKPSKIKQNQFSGKNGSDIIQSQIRKNDQPPLPIKHSKNKIQPTLVTGPMTSHDESYNIEYQNSVSEDVGQSDVNKCTEIKDKNTKSRKVAQNRLEEDGGFRSDSLCQDGSDIESKSFMGDMGRIMHDNEDGGVKIKQNIRDSRAMYPHKGNKNVRNKHIPIVFENNTEVETFEGTVEIGEDEDASDYTEAPASGKGSENEDYNIRESEDSDVGENVNASSIDGDTSEEGDISEHDDVSEVGDASVYEDIDEILNDDAYKNSDASEDGYAMENDGNANKDVAYGDEDTSGDGDAADENEASENDVAYDDGDASEYGDASNDSDTQDDSEKSENLNDASLDEDVVDETLENVGALPQTGGNSNASEMKMTVFGTKSRSTDKGKSSQLKIIARVKKKDQNNRLHLSSTENEPNEDIDTHNASAISSNDIPHTIINIEPANQDDISETDSELLSQSLNTSVDFQNEFGRFRIDRPSLALFSSDDDEMSQSYRDYLRFIKSQESKPRQISDPPSLPGDAPVQSAFSVPSNLPVAPSRHFTILAITNGKLDLDVEDVVIEIDEDAGRDNTAD